MVDIHLNAKDAGEFEMKNDHEMPEEIWASRNEEVGDRFTIFQSYDDQVKYIRSDLVTQPTSSQERWRLIDTVPKEPYRMIFVASTERLSDGKGIFTQSPPDGEGLLFAPVYINLDKMINPWSRKEIDWRPTHWMPFPFPPKGKVELC